MSYYNLDGQGFFSSIFNFIIGVFVDSISLLDHILIGNFSMLDFSLALLALGLVIAVTLSTVSNFVSGGAGSMIRGINEQERAEKRAIEKAKYKKGKKGN